MDPPRRPLEEMSQDELLALALDKGITDETDQEKLMECLGAMIATEAKETYDPPGHQMQNAPPIPPDSDWDMALGTSDERVGAELPAPGSSSTSFAAGSDAAATAFTAPSVVGEVAPQTGILGGIAPSDDEEQGTACWAWPRSGPSDDSPPSRGGNEDQGDSSAGAGAAAASSESGAAHAGGEASAVTAATDTMEEPVVEGDESSSGRQELVDTFVGVTQESRSKAWQFLNATDWNIDAALNLFMESGGDGGGAAGAAGGSVAGRSSAEEEATAGEEEEERSRDGHGYRAGAGAISEGMAPSVAEVGQDAARVARSRARGGRSRRPRRGNRDADKNDDDVSEDIAEVPTLASMEEMLGTPDVVRSRAHASRANLLTPSTSASGAGGEAGAYDSRYPNGFSEDGVRAPLPNIRDVLIRGVGPDQEEGGVMGALQAAMGSRADVAAEEKDTTDWIFHPPEGLSLPSSFMDTRTICKEQKKWLMVNIQDHEEFASHRLNKDVWSNETIQTLLRGNFVFWQRNKTLGQARYYMEKYNLAGEVLPHTAIIDPRTGAQLVKVLGFVEPEDLSTVLLEFLENNNLDQTKAPKLKVIGMGNVAHEIPKDTAGKEGGAGDDRNSPGKNSSTGGVGDSYNVYESFGSDDYEYDDDDEDLGQGSSVDGNDGDSTSRASTGTSTSVPNTIGLGTTPNPNPASPSPSPSAASIREPRKTPIGAASGRAAAATAASAVGAAELLGPWGHGTPAEEAAARALASEDEAGRLEAAGVGGGNPSGEVPREPEPGEGVTQVRFRLPNGVTPATIARRFWLQDRVSILFQYVRNTVEDGTMRQFDLLSGHPPTSLSASKHLTVKEANLSNSAILMRWT